MRLVPRRKPLLASRCHRRKASPLIYARSVSEGTPSVTTVRLAFGRVSDNLEPAPQACNRLQANRHPALRAGSMQVCQMALSREGMMPTPKAFSAVLYRRRPEGPRVPPQNVPPRTGTFDPRPTYLVPDPASSTGPLRPSAPSGVDRVTNANAATHVPARKATADTASRQA